MIYLTLFYTFFMIGLFGFGGGYGIISLIQHEAVVSHHWMSSAEFTNIIAISQMTPGPIGINSATYCGYTALLHATGSVWMGVLGSLVATLALVLPSFILMLLISKMFLKYMQSNVVQSVFLGLRPAIVGLMAAATLLLCNSENFNSPDVSQWHFGISIFIFVATLIGVKVKHINPIRMICYAAFAGLLLLY
ncbi:MAG: chromate transporter [Prevotella sp.]|nr:chromate transporter [Prevotella sp.]MBR4650988.1 chromate transporter [Prevotella sp.]